MYPIAFGALKNGSSDQSSIGWKKTNLIARYDF